MVEHDDGWGGGEAQQLAQQLLEAAAGGVGEGQGAGLVEGELDHHQLGSGRHQLLKADCVDAAVCGTDAFVEQDVVPAVRTLSALGVESLAAAACRQIQL